MAIAPTDYQDHYGLEPEVQEAYGAKSERTMQARALKQYNPAAGQLQTINPNTAPGPKKVQAPRGVAPYTPSRKASARSTSAPAPTPAPAPNATPPISNPDYRGFGPSSGMGTEPGQAPVNGNLPRRGFGPKANIVPDEPEPNRPLSPPGPASLTRGPGEALRRMAALPGASRVIQLYARIAAQEGLE